MRSRSTIKDRIIIQQSRENQGNRGGYIGGGREGRGFGGGRGPIVFHNYQKPRHYARDFPLPPRHVCIVTEKTMKEKFVQHFC
jgi:hypothetical protein